MANVWQNVLTTSIVVIVFVIATLGVYYLTMFRNIKKRREHFEQLHSNLKVGQRVEFANGLRGTIKYITDEECDIEIKSGAIMTVSRYTISDVLK